jgi:hypothetical protein
LPSAKNRVFTNYYNNTVARRTVNSVMKKNLQLLMIKGTWQRGGFSGVFAEIGKA